MGTVKARVMTASPPNRDTVNILPPFPMCTRTASHSSVAMLAFNKMHGDRPSTINTVLSRWEADAKLAVYQLRAVDDTNLSGIQNRKVVLLSRRPGDIEGQRISRH